MFLFKQELETLLSSVRSGKSAHVIAMPGMQASLLLDRVQAALSAEGFHIIRFDGYPDMREVDFFSLEAAGFDRFGARGVRPLGALADAIAEELSDAPLRAILLDAVECIDRPTLGLAQTVARRLRVPVVFSRFRGLAGTESARYSALDPGIRVELSELDYAGTFRLLEERLGGDPGPEITSRVYAGSAGIPELIIAYADGAQADRLIRFVENRWTMVANTLASATVAARLEAMIATLSREEIEEVERIANSQHDERTAADGLSTTLVRRLQGKGFVVSNLDSAGARYTLHPPALAAYFAADGGATFSGDRSAVELLPVGAIPHAVRAHRQNSAEALASRRYQWRQNPTVEHAIAYLLSLPAGAEEQIANEVFVTTQLASASGPLEAFDFTFLRATWAGAFAREAFEPFIQLFPAWNDTLQVFLQILFDAANLPGERLDAGDQRFIGNLPGADILMMAYAYVSLVAGRFADAQQWVERVIHDESYVVRWYRGFIAAMVQLGSGTSEEAIADIETELVQAIRGGEYRQMLLYSYVAVLALLGSGRWSEARAFAEQAIAFGPPQASEVPVYRALLFTGSFLTGFSGDIQHAVQCLAQVGELGSRSWPLPGMQPEMGDALQEFLDQRPAVMTQKMRVLAQRLNNEGAAFAAMQTLRIALMTWPDSETMSDYAEVSSRISMSDPAPFVGVMSAAFSDVSAIGPLVDSYQQDDHLATLVLALAALARRSTQDGDEAQLYQAMALLAEKAGTSIDLSESLYARPMTTSTLELSPREREIALLAFANSNTEIAARLGLSVRTVESHLYNAFRKTGVADRQQLIEFIQH